VLVATLAIVGVALVEAAMSARIGTWTGATLLLVSGLASWVTRAGDRSLPAMMPPLAFLAAALVAGQAVLPAGYDSWQRQGVMLVDVLGSNASWVLAATFVSVCVAALRRQR
jgi:hypothetical protein